MAAVTAAPPSPHDSQRRLVAFTAWLLGVGTLGAATYFTVCFAYVGAGWLETLIGSTIFLGGVLAGRHLAARGRAQTGAMTIALSLLTTALFVAPCCPYAWPSLALGALLAVAVALPYMRGRALSLVLFSSFVIGTVVILWGTFSHRPSGVPEPLKDSLVAGSSIALLTLIVLQLRDHSWRLHKALAEAIDAAEESRAAYGRIAEVGELRDAIIEASPAAVMLLDLDGTVRLWNRRAERLFGWSASEVIGRPLPTVPEDKEDQFRRYLEQIGAGRPVMGLETRSRRRDGGQTDVELWAAPIRHDGAVQCLSLLVDITDRKLTEAALRGEEENARRAFEAARRADRRKDEFLALLGHELRNPLAPIVTALQLMKLKGGGPTRELGILERQVQHLVRLVDDLLDVSRITRGKIRLKRERLDVAEAIESAVEMAGPLIEERRHSLTVKAPAKELWIDGDHGRIAQVIANLLTNAAKYTEPEGRIALEARREGEEVCVSVTDDGIGIDPDVVPRLFQPFAQGEKVPGHTAGGLGLGLMLVQSLVEMHGGRVDVQSDGPGRGSSFRVWLSLSAAAELEAREEAAGEDPSLAAADRGRVLVVDDNQDAADMLADVLRHRGWDVAIAHDGPSALGVARDFRPAVAILDIGLPVMNGYELCRHLREQAQGRPIRFLAVTGYGQDKDRERSLEAGFTAHLVKPVDVQALMSALASQ